MNPITAMRQRQIDEPTQEHEDPRRHRILVETDSLAERYARMAERAYAPRRSDLLLRGLDILIAASLLVVLSPLAALISLAILLTSGRPVVYRGARVGRAGQIFTMMKFRTLRADAETRLGPYLGEELTRLTENEVTRVGRFLRLTQLDELPQLLNVVRGDMAIVGPRPIRPAFFEELAVEIPQYWQRLVVRPGITGFAQLRMTREMSWAEKLVHDLEYIADRSVGLYLEVLRETFMRLLRRVGDALGGRRAPSV